MMFDADTTIIGKLEGINFEPALNGEDFITITVRVPKDTRLGMGCLSMHPEYEPSSSVNRNNEDMGK